jgi:hypothetical protein
MKQTPRILFAPMLPAGSTRFGIGSPLQLAPLFHPEGDAGGTGAGDQPPPKPAVAFATQAEFDATIEERLTRERERVKRQYQGIDPDRFRELEAAETKRKQKEAEEQQNYQAALKSQEESFGAKEKTWLEERNALTSELHTERISNKLIAAAVASNAYDPSQVAKLLGDRVKLGDDRQPVVLNEQGQPAFKEGTALSGAVLEAAALDGVGRRATGALQKLSAARLRGLRQFGLFSGHDASQAARRRRVI